MESLALPRCAACGRVPHAEVGWAADASPASGLSPGGGTRVDSLVHARAEEDARAAADRAAEATVSRGRARSPMQRTDSKSLRNAVLRFSLFVVYF